MCSFHIYVNRNFNCKNVKEKKRVNFIMSKTYRINCNNNTRMSFSMNFSLKEHKMETCTIVASI